MAIERRPTGIPQQLTLRWAIFFSLLLSVGGLSGCDKVTSVFHRTPLPDLGPRLAHSVKLTFDPSFTNLTMQYIDGCNSPHELNVGEVIESLMIDAASKNFRAVTVDDGIPAQIPPDKEIIVTLQRSGLKLWADHVYDRVPADMTIETLVALKDARGKELGEQTISIVHNQRLILEPTPRRCDYGNMREFVHDAGIALSTQFIRAVRTQLAAMDGTAPAPVTAAPVRPAPPATALSSQGTPSALMFKATVLDENSNLVVEGGERIRVRVDLVNRGELELQGVTTSLTGTASLLAQFPTTTLSIGRLQAGQSRSIEFVATIPQSLQPEQAEIYVAVSDSGTHTQPPPQTLALAIQPTGIISRRCGSPPCCRHRIQATPHLLDLNWDRLVPRPASPIEKICVLGRPISRQLFSNPWWLATFERSPPARLESDTIGYRRSVAGLAAASHTQGCSRS